MLASLYPLIRPLLFRLDPEQAHDLTLGGLDLASRLHLLRSPPANPGDAVTLQGLHFRNRIGLAAGLDKAAAHLDALAHLGFGFIEAGTVTPKPQAGNPKPRLFRLARAHALINRFGFNNPGLERFLHNVQGAQLRSQGCVLGLNIGKNAATPIENASDDYVLGLLAVHAAADYITVNISSPNTQALRSLQGGDALMQLLSALQEARKAAADRDGRRVPMWVKIAPDLEHEALEPLVEQLLAHEVDGLIATNTTLDRQGLTGQANATEAGGLSGAPLTTKAQSVLESLSRFWPSDHVLVGAGGIMNGQHAAARISAGADLIQLYTGLVYRGPQLVQECIQALRAVPPAVRLL